MQPVRCSCGALHACTALKCIGRQHGAHGDYADLANCPVCGSTICIDLKLHGAPTDESGSADSPKFRGARARARA